jgi:hypothetical protein
MKNTYTAKSQTIENLCKNIVAASSAQLQEHGVISPTFICVGLRRTVHWTAQSLSNKSVLAEFVNDCRLLCVAEEATNAMFVAQISIGSEKSPAIKTPGSSTKYGHECLLIQIETDEGQNESFMVPIIPHASGKPTLGISRIMVKGLLAGITNELLPKAKPTEAERTVAGLALQHNPRLTGYSPLQSN